MRKYRLEVYEITLFDFIKLFLRNYLGFILFFAALSFVLLIITFNQKILLDVLKFNFILLFGVFLSFILHEYMHIHFMKKEHVDKDEYVEVHFGITKVSIIPKFDTKPETMLKVASLPLVMMFAVGIIMLLISLYFNISFLMYTSFIYMFHIVNIIPVFGDGIVFFKSLRMIFKNIEGR